MLGIVLQTASGAIAITVPTATLPPLLFPEQVAAVRAKADADTAQWQAFKASLDADLEEFILGSYQYTGMTRAADYALGYYALAVSDPTTAADYAGKAIGAALSCARDNHQGSIGHWQTLGLGDGVEVDFELPGTEIVSGTLTVYNLADGAAAGTSGGTVDPADYTLVGTTITFDTPPASGRKIWATAIYHDGDLRYQQTGGGTGGVNDGPYDADQLYADRFFSKTIGPVVDWCWEFAEFTTELKDELLQAMVDSFDMSADWSYAPPTSVKSNYGVGRWINCCFAAVSVQGRHADASRLLSEVETMWTTVAVQFDSPATGQATLRGGFTSEGLSSYGRATAENLMVATSALGEAGWTISEDADLDIRQWAGDHIRFLLHARYDETETDYSGQARPGLVFEAGDNSVYPVPSPPKANYAIASGLSSDTDAAAYARYLVENKDGDHEQDCWDVLFYDPSGTATNWTTDTPGLTHRAEGTGVVLARSAWDYASPWLALHCGNRGADHAEPSAGYMVAYRGADRLLINGRDVGRRYLPDQYHQSLGSLANHVVIDDAGAGIQTNRWNNTYTYGGSNPGVTVPNLDESNGHVVSAFDCKNIYYRNTGATNPVTELDATVCFIPASGLIFRYDRITTGSSGYQKELRYHVASTTHPWNTGTFTLTKPGGGTTSDLAWNISAADLKTAIDALYSVTTTVVKMTDGMFEVTFPAAGTHAIMTGASSESGGVVTVYDFHPTGDSGSGTIQVISHASDITGVQQQDVSSSRMFLRVDSTDGLTETVSLVNCAESGETARLCRQLRWRVADAVTVSRLATAIQLTSTATGSMDDCVFVTGDNGELEGYVVDSLNIAVWFRKAASLSLPEVLDLTCSGTVTHHITGLAPSTVYELTGAVESTITTNVYGNAIFTTSATDPEVTIADYEPEVGDPVFSLTAVSDSVVGITDTLAANFGDVYIVKPIEFNDNGKAHLLIGQHNGGNVGIYSQGTGFAFTLEEVLDWDGVSGGILGFDIDHDGTIDAAHWGEGSGYDSIIWNGDEDYSLLQSNWWGGHNYITSIYENEGTGYVETYEEAWQDYPTSLTVTTRVCSFNGTSWSANTSGTAGPPSGIPSEVIDEMEAELYDGVTIPKPSTTRFLTFFHRHLDLTGTGSPNDLVSCIYRGYSGGQRVWLMTDDGDGTYTYRNAEWGVPTGGGHVILPSQPGHQRPFYHFPGYTDATWYDFAGTGRPDLFLSNRTDNSGYTGHMRWTGSGYEFIDSPLNDRLDLDGDYPKRLYAVDFMNRGILDLVLQNPRPGTAYVFINDGAGNFTEYRSVRCWDNQGLDFLIDQTTGLTHLLCGGDTGIDSGVASGKDANVFSIFENTSTDVGNWLGIKLRRTGHANKFAVGAKVEVHTAGQSFSGASMLRRWYARPDGQALIFGLGNASTADVKVTWPDGTTSTQTGVSQGQTIVEDGA